MRITLESDYALRILAELAYHDEITDAKTISANTSITLRFTLKILHKLVVGELVESYKGVKGGYKLKISADKITLKAVIEMIDGPIAIARCLDSDGGCSLNCDKTVCEFHHIFDTVSTELASKLNAITIRDVINKTYSLSKIQ